MIYDAIVFAFGSLFYFMFNALSVFSGFYAVDLYREKKWAIGVHGRLSKIPGKLGRWWNGYNVPSPVPKTFGETVVMDYLEAMDNRHTVDPRFCMSSAMGIGPGTYPKPPDRGIHVERIDGFKAKLLSLFSAEPAVRLVKPKANSTGAK